MDEETITLSLQQTIDLFNRWNETALNEEWPKNFDAEESAKYFFELAREAQ